MKTIGIIGAMETEVASLIGALENPVKETYSGTDFHTGTLDGTPVVIARCGIGKVAAAVTAEAMILRYAPDLLLNTGVGGSLTKDLTVGDLAVSAFAVEYDMDTSPLGDPIGYLSGIGQIRLAADGAAADCLLSAAKDAGLHAVRGGIASGDRFVASVEEKKRILSHFPDAVVCEMEGAAVAHTAFLNGTPFVIVRAVSDSADGQSDTDYPTFVAAAAARCAALVRAALPVLR